PRRAGRLLPALRSRAARVHPEAVRPGVRDRARGPPRARARLRARRGSGRPTARPAATRDANDPRGPGRRPPGGRARGDRVRRGARGGARSAPMNGDFGVYVHVPWCRHVCPYCDFNVYAARTPPERDYVATLGAEITAHARDAPWAPPRGARSVYLG